jgi:hypothetical protein
VAETSDAGRRGVRLASVAGVVIGLLASVLVVRTLLDEHDAIEDALDSASWGWLGLAIVLAYVGMTAIAVPWRRVLRVLGEDLPTGQVVARYYLGEIGKYLPGGVWPVVGRAELARRAGVRRAVAYSSVALSLATLYLGALLVAGAGLPALLGGDDEPRALAVLVLLPLGIAALHPAVLSRARGFVERLARRDIDVPIPSWGTTVGLVARYVPAWLAIGGATWAVARSLDPGADVANVAAAAVLSWAVGFVLVPVPGGVGVREATFVAAAASLEPGLAAATAVAARAIFVLVDGSGAAIAAAVLARRGREGDPPVSRG